MSKYLTQSQCSGSSILSSLLSLGWTLLFASDKNEPNLALTSRCVSQKPSGHARGPQTGTGTSALSDICLILPLPASLLGST